MAPESADTPAYLQPDRAASRRVEDLLDRMTVEEKVAQLTAVRPDEVTVDGELDGALARERLSNGVGHLTRVGGHGGFEPGRVAELVRELQSFLAAETRLGVPAIPHEECLSGYMGPGGSTFPQAIGLASTFDPDLVEETSRRIRGQLLAVGARHALSPVLDVGRDPRWGRIEETFGEDPHLVARMGVAYVRGLQGAEPSEGVSATAKHFVGHGAGEGGRNRSSVQVGERALREVHLRPFEAAVREAGVESVMNAYHDVDGVPCAGDERLLTDVLRGEWGFDGTVVSDYHSVRFLRDEHGVAATAREAAVRALEAGLDVELPLVECYDELVGAVADGDLAEATVDAAVRRVLRQKVEKGLFESPAPDSGAVADAFGPDANREHARRLARASLTLLTNDGTLPLDDPASVAVVGPKADSPAGQLGDYAYAAHYPAREATRRVVTPLSALRDRLGEDRVAYAPGCTTTGSTRDGFDDAVAAVEGSDVAVAFVGARSAVALAAADGEVPAADAAPGAVPDAPTSGEGADVVDLSLPGVQGDLLAALAATDVPLVVVLVSGKPHAVPELHETASAVAHAWLPGEEGGNGIADVLLGSHGPGGRLPVSVAKHVGQLPVYYARRPNSRRERHVSVDADPLYPFGHGLTYADFDYDPIRLDRKTVAPAGTVTASVAVENVGDRAGHEVVQLYAHERSPTLVRPVQELVGFERVRLAPGESATVAFELPTARLASHDREMNLVVEPGEFELRVGRSAADVASSGVVEVVGERWTVPRSARRFVTPTTVERA
jgi:beta-glucosidase